MNPNKKKELIKRVQNAYKVYTMDMLEWQKDPEGKNINPSINNTEEYYDSIPEIKRVKPNIRYYLNKEELEVLKKILNKKNRKSYFRKTCSFGGISRARTYDLHDVNVAL